ncbi:MAG: Asp-tRNA(Asn)/Glu-tRNA(Gln) amidotransferase subunit GatC [Elusimicrobia bacterium]|nr:Asp-tRNA(Asn)/Glu-tRNA(Gln) amidotransferase subunit GatC [Elusimicrobiota bacterium]
MDITQIEKIAELARLHLTEKEKKEIPEKLTEILEYIDQLKELDTSGVPAELEQSGNLRLAEDIVDEFGKIEALTGNAPDFGDGFFRVKKIIE